MKNKLRNNYGITLVALVVTVIVLLILAGVSIGLVFDSDGLFSKANQAASKYNQAKEDEADFLNKILGGYTGGDEPGNKKEESILTLSATSGEITYPNTGTFEIMVNSSNGNLTVSSSDDSIASANISGNIVTITPKSITGNEKEVLITVKSEETATHKSQTAVYVATIKQGGITINAVPNVRQYTGTAFDALSSVIVTPEDATVEYSLNDGAYQSEIPQVTEAGEYTIAIRASKDGYATKETSITVTVNKQSNTTGNLALSETSGTVTYPNTKTVNITNNASNGTLSVSSSNPSVATASVSNNQITITPQAVTSSGQTATITVKSAATSNYEEQTTAYTITVNQGTISISATAYSGEYDGSSHTAILNIVVNPTDCSLSYKLENENYTSSIPTITTQGSYTVTMMASKLGYKTQTKILYPNITLPPHTNTGTGATKYINLISGKKLINTKDVYGADVLGYTCSRTGTNWQIFYIDGTDNDRVYLISKDYMAPPTTDTDLVKGTYSHTYYWNTYTLKNKYNTTIPSTEFTRKFLKEYQGVSASTEKLQATNYMLNQTVWKEYKGIKADYVYGGPTLPLFQASYNDICDTSQMLYCEVISGNTGYSINWNEKGEAYGSTNTQNGIYFKGAKDSDPAAGMYLASPAYLLDSYLMESYYTGRVGMTTVAPFLTDCIYGFRPIVELKTTVKFIDNGNKTYTISN